MNRVCDGCSKERHDDGAGYVNNEASGDIFWFCFFCRKENERGWYRYESPEEEA